MAATVLSNVLPERLDLAEELDLLRNNFLQQVRLNGIRMDTVTGDSSIDSSNWVVTFPYNYFYIGNDPDIDFIRKLALINLLYGFYIFTEDDILDEKLTSPDNYQAMVTKFCAMRPLRNLAIGFLLELCGSAIYQYIYDYEYAYYRALLKERQPTGNNKCSLNSGPALTVLGMKSIPLCIPFAAFCLVTGRGGYIPDCESLVLHYHIAHQLFDDIIDLNRDVQKPDQSWLIRYIAGQLASLRIDKEDICAYLRDTNLFNDIKFLINSYLDRSVHVAEKLAFHHFIEHVRSFRGVLENFSIINHIDNL